ncbi:MAG: UBP-type zinc finger domain-containing protein [Candidatus Doudnabacteria bacterium]|nr:UBP-type zinc finger domain-containing protein [Candidatus Doudnabacteria bacterium]
MSEPWKYIKKQDCPHLPELKEDIVSDKKACEVCGVTHDLRICLTCGAVHCCESDKAHNIEHFQITGHPFIRPHNSPYNFLWCYKCNAFLK